MIKYYKHAEDQIKERKVSKKEVEMAIKNPVEVVNGRRNRKIAHKVFNGKLLRVVYEEEEDEIIVVSAYRAEPKRYLGREKWR